MFTENEEAMLSTVPDCLWSKGKADVGLIKGIAAVSVTPKSSFRPHQRQYPLKPDAEAGIEPIIADLFKAGVLIDCPDSPCHTPLFTVKKAPPASGWRMVQDLQAVNKAVNPRAPTVPDPHTLLNDLLPENKFFTVVDISNAFFSIPVHKDSQFWFAFTFKRKRYTYTRIPHRPCLPI